MLDFNDEAKSIRNFMGCGFIAVLFFYLVIIAAIAGAIILVIGALR